MAPAPSSRWLSLVHKECGWRVASVPVLIKSRHNRSLTWLCSEWWPKPKRQDRPWCPSTVTVLPRTQTCELPIGAPRRRPTAMRTVELSIFKQTLTSGREVSQSPDPSRWTRGDETGTRSARSVIPFNRVSARILQQASSQVLWAFEVGPDGASMLRMRWQFHCPRGHGEVCR